MSVRKENIGGVPVVNPWLQRKVQPDTRTLESIVNSVLSPGMSDSEQARRNRHGLIVDAMATQADGTAERDAALLRLHRKWRSWQRRGRRKPMSVGADKAHETRDFVQTARAMNIRPHVAQSTKRSGGSGIDGRTTRHESHAVNQGKRQLFEKAFGSMKQTGGMRKTKLRGLAKVAWQLLMSAAFNLWHLPKLQTAEVWPGTEKRRFSTPGGGAEELIRLPKSLRQGRLVDLQERQ